MKIFCTSDTHGMHKEINKWLPPKGVVDTFVFAGDMTGRDTFAELTPFCDWLKKEIKPRFEHVVMIAGNHDETFEALPELCRMQLADIGVHYLDDSGITLDGVRFWGSPITPMFCDWHFMRLREEEIKRHWNMIPDDTQVLITHGPAYGILDSVKTERVGCQELKERLDKLTQLKAHICGHVHAAYGREQMWRGTFLVNCAACNEQYKIVNPPITIDLDRAR